MTVAGVEIAQPWFLLAALLAVPAVWWSKRGTGRVMFSSFSALPVGSSWRTRLAWLPDALIGIAVVGFAIALSGPRKGEAPSRVRREGIGIVMAIDISGSMRAQDLADDTGKSSGESPGRPSGDAARCNYDRSHDPTRLGAVKRVFEQFVIGGANGLDGRPDDAVGLVAFARYADTRSPLTLDHDNLITAARQLDFAVGDDDGTAIGAGLELAVQRVAEFKARSKVVVLLTDGESNVHDIDEADAIADAIKRGVKVYTIGAGTTGVAPICADDGSPGGALMRMPVSIDEGLLRKIAEKTGGHYFRATDARTLKNIYVQIDKLERTTIDEQRFLEYKQYYPWFVAMALALVIAALTLRSTALRRLP